MKNFSHEYDFLNEIPTPFYVLDSQKLLEEVNKLNKAIALYWPNTITAYSVKTNSLPFLANFLSIQGLSAEVVSEDEYNMVSLCGYSDEKIVCNGPVKSEEFIGKLMDNHVKVNLDSHRELDYAIHHARNNPHTQYAVGLRVNVDIESHFPLESTAGDQGSRFGFCVDNGDLGNAITRIKESPNIMINGLHLHVSTSTRRIEIYRFVTRLFISITTQYHLSDISYFDIGGGFYGGMPNKPQWNDYLSAIAEELNFGGFSFNKLTLVLEPGVSLLAGSFSYYASVIDIKDTNRSRFVVTDGSRIHIDPLFHKTSYYYQHIKSGKTLAKKHARQILVGFTCLEYDNIMVIENGEEIAVDDIFCFDKLGAYTLSLSPLFISFFPAVYVKDFDGTLQCVRRKWTANDFLQGSIHTIKMM